MTTGRLRDTFALLLRETHSPPAALSADAERSIRRRIGLRWAGRIGALVVVGALGTAALAGAYGGWSGGDGALPSPIPTPTLGRAAVTFPVTGGPEFVSAAAGLKCGDPAPAPHPKEHDVELALTQVREWHMADPIQAPYDLPAVWSYLMQADDTELGIVGDSGISLLVERDGVIVGTIPYTSVDVGWNSSRGRFQDPEKLVATWISCQGVGPGDSSGIKPGTYDVIAITRVFSTPESVALFQKLGYSVNTWNLDPDSLDAQGIYLPGSYDCAQTVGQHAPARACLPDFTPDATYNAADATVTMLYDTKDFIEEFSAVLVSEPVTVTIPGKDDITWMQNSDRGSQDVFDSVDDFTCGASASTVWINAQAGKEVSTWLDDVSAGPVSAGGAFTASAWATGVPDSSTVELMPGARIVYLQDSMTELPDSTSRTMIETVAGSSEVSAANPITTDRFSGPKPLGLVSGPSTPCPGVDAAILTRQASPVLVGTWRITAPDGTATTVDAGSYLWEGFLGG